jgi:spore germination protein GerM
MVRKRYSVYAIAVLAAIAGVVVLLVLVKMKVKDTQRTGGYPPAETPETLKKQTSTVHLYFAAKDNAFLIAEDHTLNHPEDPTDLSRRIIEALIKGPARGLARTIPLETQLRAVYITAGGVCYVDLSAEVTENHPGGVQSELLTLYSIVNSLVLNIPEIDAVKILIAGREATTLADHIDLQYPVKANMLFIR